MGLNHPPMPWYGTAYVWILDLWIFSVGTAILFDDYKRSKSGKQHKKGETLNSDKYQELREAVIDLLDSLDIPNAIGFEKEIARVESLVGWTFENSAERKRLKND